MAEKKITPDEIPGLTTEALAIGTIFISTIGTIPMSIPALLMKLPSILAFFKQAKPHLQVILKEIKD